MTLDVGCGYTPRGDVNCDIKMTPCVDVICSAEALPFKDGSFDEVHSQFVIEHCADPVRMIREMVRVTRNKAIITTNDISWPGYALHSILGKGFLMTDPEHVYGWSAHYMRNLLHRLGLHEFKVSYLTEYGRDGRIYSKLTQRLFYWFVTWPLSKLGLKPDFRVEVECGIVS